MIERARAIARIDAAPAHRPPATARVVVATAASVACSLLAAGALVSLATWTVPSTRHFSHFRPGDYGTLTTGGVIAAGIAWWVVTRFSSAPRWVFLRLAVLVTLVLWLPDGWLLVNGESPAAVGALMAMHLAVALVTYNFLVHGARVGREGVVGAEPAPARRREPSPSGREPFGIQALMRTRSGAGEEDRAPPTALRASRPRAIWVAMAGAVGVEFLLGIADLFVVPVGRPSGWLPARGEALYIAHTILGCVLAFGGALLVVRAAGAGRLARIGAVAGVSGLTLGVLGGVLASYHPSRLVGMGLMLIGAVVAGFGYLTPVMA